MHDASKAALFCFPSLSFSPRHTLTPLTHTAAHEPGSRTALDVSFIHRKHQKERINSLQPSRSKDLSPILHSSKPIFTFFLQSLFFFKEKFSLCRIHLLAETNRLISILSEWFPWTEALTVFPSMFCPGGIFLTFFSSKQYLWMNGWKQQAVSCVDWGIWWKGKSGDGVSNVCHT